MTDANAMSRLSTMRQLEILISVADHGSMTGAAEALHLSHPAVSLQVRKLSESVGLPLHEVIGKRLYLTEAGQEVLKSAREVFGSLRRLDERLNGLKGLTAGRLSISVVTTAKYFLPKLLGPFCREYPNIDVSFNVGNRTQIIQRFDDNRDDLYIFNDLPTDISVVAHRFLPNPLVVVASSKHPLAKRKGLRWSDLEGEKIIMREEGSGTNNAIRSHLAAHGHRLGKTMIIESNEAIKYAVAENMGISILSAYVLADGVGQELVQLRVEGFPILSDWYVVHPAAKTLSLVADRFLEFIQKKGGDVLPMENLERQVQRAMSQS